MECDKEPSLDTNAYPHNPSAGTGYAEGWINFNTAWNSSLAYMAYEDTSVKVYGNDFANEIASCVSGNTIGIQLNAPLNFNYKAVESGHVIIETSSGDYEKLRVTETGESSGSFRGTVQAVSSDTHARNDGILQVPSNGWFTISYGYGTFKKQVKFVGNALGTFIKQ